MILLDHIDKTTDLQGFTRFGQTRTYIDDFSIKAIDVFFFYIHFYFIHYGNKTAAELLKLIIYM